MPRGDRPAPGVPPAVPSGSPDSRTQRKDRKDRKDRKRAKGPHVPAGIRPTTRGAGMLVLAFAAYAAALILGSAELYALASACAVCVIVCAVALTVAPGRLRCDRTVDGGHSTAGDDVRILYHLTVSHASLFPVRRVLETLQRGRRDAETLLLTGVVANDTTSVAFDALPRGVYRLGPARVVRRDPLGLFWRVTSDAAGVPLRVWPRLVPMRSAIVAAAAEGADASSVLRAHSGDEFKQLREFTRGDDRRMVHWKASAKRAKLLVRETEAESFAQATVVLDCRTAAYAGVPTAGAPTGPVTDGDLAGFEDAVSAAASLVSAFAAEGWRVRLATIGPPLANALVFDDPAAVLPAMEVLAEVTTQALDADVAAQTLDALRRGASGTLVVISGLPDSALAAAAAQAGRGFDERILVWTDAVRSGQVGGLPAGAHLRSVAPPTARDLPAAWYTAARAGRGAGTQRGGVR